MTDIVDRLRKPNMNALTVEERFLLIVGIMNEAADEIERLRKIEAAVYALRWDDRGLLMAGVDELRDAVGGGQDS